ncbi:MAG TPA: 1-deoxy-D-xylulose-5-phosphate reductoisomerase [candidate division Zixibacteria bacterium]
MKNVVVLGSTGSIGRNALEVLSHFPDQFTLWGISANSNVNLLEEQIRQFKPRLAVVADEKSFPSFPRNYDTEIFSGLAGLKKLCTAPEVDLVINALVGSVGLIPSLDALESGKTLATANKESLVMAGELLIRKAKEKGTEIIPIDSEHSAIQQCLLSGKKNEVKRIILTASGGPFWGKSETELSRITVEEALSHPTWEMGKKISVDSASLMNKGLEVIEAHWLFDVPPDRIKVVIHPQSIVHSMVEFVDGSVIAQMSVPDMKLPLQYALFYPRRVYSPNTTLDLTKTKQLTFFEPDFDKFPCLKLAYHVLEMGGTAPAVLNSANEAAVNAFLSRQIKFTDIYSLLHKVLIQHQVKLSPSLDDILNADKWGRQKAEELCFDMGRNK